MEYITFAPKNTHKDISMNLHIDGTQKVIQKRQGLMLYY